MEQDNAGTQQAEPVGEEGQVVKQGDGIASIAWQAGHFWETVWNDPANTALREARGMPEVLLPGDRVFIPPLQPKSVRISTGKRHVFRRRGVPSRLQIRLAQGGEPRRGLAYTLEVDGVKHKGESDGDGWIRQWVPPDARQGELRLGDGTVHRLTFGTLFPVTDERGIRQRLSHLGILPWKAESAVSPEEAVAAFQRLHGLTPSGQADEQTQKTLVEAHGS